MRFDLSMARKRIGHLRGKRYLLERELLDYLSRKKLIAGTPVEKYKRCNKGNCKCTRGELHGPTYYISRKEDGKTKMIYIRQALWPVAEKKIKLYQRWRRTRAGETDFITGTGWALLDKFFVFLREIDFYNVLEKTEGEGYQRIMVTLVRLLTTYSAKVLLGIAPLRQVPMLLFKDVGLLKQIGFTAIEISEGICKRGKGKSKPMHRKILGDLLCRLTEKEVFRIFNGGCIKGELIS